MPIAFLAFSAVVPSLLLVWYFHSRDGYPEPRGVLWAVFGLGILIVFPVLVVARPLEIFIEPVRSPILHGLLAAFLQAAIPEEFFKFVVLWWFAARQRAFDEPIDGVVYGVIASLGFATLENVLYVAGGGLQAALTRALTAVSSHAFLGAIMGYFVGRAKFSPTPSRHLLWAVALPTLLHGLYNFPLLAAQQARTLEATPVPLLVGLTAMAPLIVVAEWIVAVRLTRRLRAEQQAPLATPAGRTSSLILTGAGALVGAVGGILLLGFTAGRLLGVAQGDEAEMLVAAGVMFGLAPTLIGTALFVWGIRRLNEAGRSST